MSQKKNTARITTGIHSDLLISSGPMRAASAVGQGVASESGPVRTPKTQTIAKSMRFKPILPPSRIRPTTSTTTALSPADPLLFPLTDSSLYWSDTPRASVVDRSTSPAPPVQRPGVLDESIAVYTRFATWLETQTYVHADTILNAVERDGSQFFFLAKSTIAFDSALRGNAPAPPAENGVDTPLGERARTLRVFAQLLEPKPSEGNLSNELETAVLRDGEALLRLATRCMEFEEAVRGSGDKVGS